jgi:hypothetical protein
VWGYIAHIWFLKNKTLGASFSFIYNCMHGDYMLLCKTLKGFFPLTQVFFCHMLEVDFLTIFVFFFVFSFTFVLDHVDVGYDLTCYQKSFKILYFFFIACLNWICTYISLYYEMPIHFMVTNLLCIMFLLLNVICILTNSNIDMMITRCVGIKMNVTCLH